MALDILESAPVIELLENFINQIRPEESMRDQVDIAYKIDDQSVIIYTIRPSLFDESKKTTSNIAKTTYVRTQNIWKIFWVRSDLKWHGYDPEPEVDDLKDFLRIVKEDRHHCFWG